MSNFDTPWTYRDFGDAVHIRNARGQFIGSMMAHGKLVIRAPDMVDLLREAREWIARDIACIIETESLCDADGKPDRSTMSPGAAAEVAGYEQFLARIDEALADITPIPEPTKADAQ